MIEMNKKKKIKYVTNKNINMQKEEFKWVWQDDTRRHIPPVNARLNNVVISNSTFPYHPLYRFPISLFNSSLSNPHCIIGISGSLSTECKSVLDIYDFEWRKDKGEWQDKEKKNK